MRFILNIYLTYSICSYLYDLGHFSVLDGCSIIGDDLLPQKYDSNDSLAEVQCCSIDGQSCFRHNPDSGECWSGNDDAAKVTWNEAYAMCTSAGYRLCNSQEELDRCCQTGCMHDLELVWISIEAGKNYEL